MAIMTLSDQLASSLGIRGEEPNIELATQIVQSKDALAVKELVSYLTTQKKAIQSDAIKVLYEVGERNPALIAPHFDAFLQLLDHKNNRLQWGAMTALSALGTVCAPQLHDHLPLLEKAAAAGSVITRDQFVAILIQLYGQASYRDTALAMILKQLTHCPVNQLPMYAERAAVVLITDHQAAFVEVLFARLPEVEKVSKRKRIEKVIKKLS